MFFFSSDIYLLKEFDVECKPLNCVYIPAIPNAEIHCCV